VEVNLNIEKKDIKFIKEFLSEKTDPVELDEIAYQIALFKTQDSRAHKVKIYNPGCEYKVDDLIYKEYPGKIPIGAKKYIEINQGVVLKVLNVRTRFDIDEIKLSYEGTSEFKKYINYLERQKIELLLPHKQEKPPKKTEYLALEKDPRQKQDPLGERDFITLKKKLAGILNKESDIAFISNKVLLSVNLKIIGAEVFDKIREFLKENKQSATTEFLVENFARVKSEASDFDSYCFALNYRMSKDYKIDFQQTRSEGWGKWNLISVIYYMKKNSLISEENPLLNKVTFSNKKNIAQRRRKFEEGVFIEGNARFYLTQREVYAGAVKLKSGLFDVDESIEIELIDGKTKKNHLLYYYRDENLILGFKEIFEKYKALQGMILAFEQTGGDDNKWQFTIRTTKKGTIADKVDYNPERKVFEVSDEKIASPVFVNKAMFLEADIFRAISRKINEYRSIETLNKLVHKIFLDFGIKERNYEIHILRLYHILDLIYPIDLKLVEEVILSNSEFIPSEKLSGVFYLDSEAVAAIEDEEYQRKAAARNESKKRRQELKRKKQEEERRLEDEIRRKREERRRKREEEMWRKEKLMKEREEQKALELKRKKEARKRAAAAKLQKPFKPKSREFDTETQKGIKKKEVPFKKKPDFVKPKEPFPVEPFPAKEFPPRKVKKRIEEEKIMRVPKRVVKKPIAEKMSEDEIKREIQLEELKAKMREKMADRKEVKKKEEVAYRDDGRFSGVLASKLDEIVKKSDTKEKKKEK
jgi:hypothetical protein